MEKAKELILDFIESEKKMRESLKKKDLITHNLLVEKIEKISIDDLKLAQKKQEPLSALLVGIIERNKNTPVTSRHLYKISEYDNKKYGKLWACYVSVANPIEGVTKLISNCFIVAKIKDEYKIIAQFNPDMDTQKWSFRGGDKELKFSKLGKSVAVERIMPPVNDEWSITEYLKDI